MPEPGARLEPLALDGANRDVERGGRLFLAQTSEVAALDDFREPRIDLAELPESQIDLEDGHRVAA